VDEGLDRVSEAGPDFHRARADFHRRRERLLGKLARRDGTRPT
jgi:hypothetical protein